MSNFYIEEHLLRPPYIPSYAGSEKPLTVLFSFLSRSDNTPLSERSRGEGHTLDNNGNIIDDPSINPQENTLEGNPNLNFEHWGEYWRKVHGIRFIHPESDDDAKILDKLVRYDQLHRFPAGPTQTDTPPYHASADQYGKLWPTVVGHIEPYQRPSWDGVAYLNFKDASDISLVLGNERVINKILPEDKAIFRDIAPLLAIQYIIIPAASGNEPITLVKIHKRKKGTSRSDFQTWWLGSFSEEVKKVNESNKLIKRYVQLHNIGPTEEGKPFYHKYTSSIDGVSLFSFDSINDLEDYLRSRENRDLEKIEKSEGETTEYWTAIGIVLVNHINPEEASA
ncbi:hypothetical protein [Xenorhabdus poinarii]|nr:hypothetical protein [Xenorhabdus poinarii]